MSDYNKIISGFDSVSAHIALKKKIKLFRRTTKDRQQKSKKLETFYGMHTFHFS